MSRIVLKCDRPVKDSLLYEQYNVGEFETTKFSSNTILLLKDVVFAQVYENYEYIRELAEDIDGKLTIIEAHKFPQSIDVVTDYEPNVSKDNPKALYVDVNVKLKAGRETITSLCEPMIIKPGIKYDIQLELNLAFDCCATIRYKSSKVQIEPGITVKFHDQRAENGDKVGIVCGLRFIKC